LKLRSIQER